MHGPSSPVPLAERAFEGETVRALAFDVAGRLDAVMAGLRAEAETPGASGASTA